VSTETGPPVCAGADAGAEAADAAEVGAEDPAAGDGTVASCLEQAASVIMSRPVSQADLLDAEAGKLLVMSINTHCHFENIYSQPSVGEEVVVL
jgi:hypothetical protein